MIILVSGISSGQNILQLLGVSILFIFILVITYYTTRFVGGVKLGQNKKGNFVVLETYKIAPNKYLQLIQIGTRYFTIAVGKDNIQFIAELQENEIIHLNQSVNPELNFLDIITKLTNKQSIKKQNNDQETDHK
jgi:flagellar protein FliO/FliZ